ncbi:hypothetical protein Hanom_Chr17g01537961 [Helianthus anomalus]
MPQTLALPYPTLLAKCVCGVRRRKVYSKLKLRNLSWKNLRDINDHWSIDHLGKQTLLWKAFNLSPVICDLCMDKVTPLDRDPLEMNKQTRYGI